jgi:predicted helicase
MAPVYFRVGASRNPGAVQFSDIHVVDLGGDVRTNPKLSGTMHNVFGIQTGIAISFFVKNRHEKSKNI